MIALDTNIWIYTHDTRFPDKQRVALELIQKSRGSLALPWQVGCEFIAACRKLQPVGFTQQDSWDALRDMRLMAQELLLPVPEMWADAADLMPRFGLSFWDSLLAAACIIGGATELHSEDFGSLTKINSLTIIHPFPAAKP